jgi:hypothetical protein
LAQNLRRLEADGLIVRHDMSEMILHVEYEFTNEAREEVCSLLSLATRLGPLRRFVLAHPWDVDVEGVGFCWSVARRA